MSNVIDDIKKNFKSSNSLTKLIYINVGIFLIFQILFVFSFLFSIAELHPSSFFALPADVSNLIKKPWALITYMFLHQSFLHLLFNMLTLYFFAPVVIMSVGVTYFVIIYVASLLIGNLLSFYFHKDEYHYSAIGASGAVMGVLYSAILFFPDMGLYLFFIPIPIPAWLFGMAYLLYSIYGMKKRLGNINYKNI